MSNSIKLSEQAASSAFNSQSGIFDELYAGNTIVKYKRDRVRMHVERYLQPNSSILELNSGTGDDAIYFAQNGHKVHATDVSAGMQQELLNKVVLNGLSNYISTERCSFTQLEQLQKRGPYDMVFSNFAGLNCTDKLETVLQSLHSLLKPNGVATLVILPKFCLGETFLLFKGKFRTAFRRWFSSNGTQAHIDGNYFKCWYYNPSVVINTLKHSFEMVDLEGLCTIVPPSYIEDFAEQHPYMYRTLKKAEGKLSHKWPWRAIGDYYIITMRKK